VAPIRDRDQLIRHARLGERLVQARRVVVGHELVLSPWMEIVGGTPGRT
jgi:hypothetical protein